MKKQDEELTYNTASLLYRTKSTLKREEWSPKMNYETSSSPNPVPQMPVKRLK